MENIAAKPVRFGEWISEGWKMFTTQWKGWVTLSLGMFAAVMVPTMIYIIFVYVTLIATAATQAGSGTSTEASPIGVFLIFASFFLLMLVILPLSALLTGGMYKAALKQLRGGQVEFKDLFSARDRLLHVLGAVLLQGLLVFLGSLLCIVPGFIVAGLLFFTLPLMIDRNLGVIEAMKASYEMAKPNLLMFTLFAFVVQLIGSVGTYACYIGLLATLPLIFTMTAVAYRDCFGMEGAALLPPAEPWAGASYSPPAPGTIALGTAPEATPAPTPRPAVCPKCQSSLPATARFCFRCGTPAPGQ
ncbi:MAG: zinc-ribbon domain-containing protein [Blastocatellia bacterium]